MGFGIRISLLFLLERMLLQSPLSAQQKDALAFSGIVMN